MPDTLSAMREFRFLEDKRNGGGLSQTEEGRWQELAQQLQQTPPAAPPADPVVYAQELIAQGYDPVQAFLHVGFSLEQIAASGYDVGAYQAAQAGQAVDPQAYAASLIAQGYDAVTAYTAAGLPVPAEAAPAPAPASPVVASPEPAPVSHHELDFADADLVEEVPHPSIPDDGTAGWTVESRGIEAAASPMTRPELEAWRTPSKPLAPLPDPGPVPHIDTQLPAEVAPAWEPSGVATVEPSTSAAELAASAVVGEAVENPFEPTHPEPLPPGVNSHVPPSRDLPAVEPAPAAEEAPLLEATPAVEEAPLLEATPALDEAPVLEAAAVAEPEPSRGEAGLEGIREVELAADEAPLELDEPGQQARPPSSAVDARERDLSSDEGEALPELELDRGGAVEPAPEAAPRPISQELELPSPERHESEWDMEADARAEAAAMAVVAEAPVAEPPPAASSPSIGGLPPRPESKTGSLPVLDASALSAEVISEGVPTRMMPALAVEFLASRTAPPPSSDTDWTSDSTSEETPAAAEVDAGPLLEATPEAEPLPVLDAEPAPVLEAAPEVAELSADAVSADEPAAPVAGAEGNGPAWPTVAELSDWSSPDKGEYAAWSAGSGGLHPYPDVSEQELAAQLGIDGLAAASADVPTPFAVPEPRVQATPAEWSEENGATGEVVLEAGDVILEGASPLAMPSAAVRGPSQARPPSEPPLLPKPIAAAPLDVVIPPATTRKSSVVIDEAALAPAPQLPPKPAFDIMPARVVPSTPRAPSVVVDQAQVAEEPPMAVDDSAFTPAGGSPVHGQAQSLRLSGERRVIVHMMDGSVRRGSFHDLDLNAAQLTLASQTGIVEQIPRDRIKAIFFMLAPGANAPAIEGSKLRVTFTDGRNIVGFSGGYDPGAVGFFIIPADARTNTERVFVLKAAIRSVANG